MIVALPFAWRIGGAESTPSVSTRSADKRLDVYFRCIVATFSSFRRWNPQADLVLISDGEPPPPYSEALRRFGVDVLLADFDHLPPEGFAPSFRTSMYMLDVLSAASRIDGWDHLVVIDPDLLCMRPLDGLIDSVGESIGAYPLPHYAVDHQINGLSRREAGAIHRE